MGIAGDTPEQAAWSLSIWNGLLIASVAGWGLHLRGKSLGFLAVIFVAIAPALLQLRSDYVLELPLTATVTFALWQLECWWNPQHGGKWKQSLIAAIATTTALLIKQSAVVFLFTPFLWSCCIAWRRNNSFRYQLLTLSLIHI